MTPSKGPKYILPLGPGYLGLSDAEVMILMIMRVPPGDAIHRRKNDDRNEGDAGEEGGSKSDFVPKREKDTD